MEREQWLGNLWRDYTAIAPNASSIRSLVEARGENVLNDHIAFRTYNLGPIDIDVLGSLVESLGYVAFDQYDFPGKKVSATAYVHPDGGPRVFLSELRVEEMPDDVADTIRSLVGQVDPTAIDLSSFYSGRLWEPVSHDVYLSMREKTEYGAWVAAHGLRPNHFTIDVNALTTFDSIRSLVDFIAEQGFALNVAGGVIKGTPDVFLEQASTMADQQPVEFSDGRFEVPTCYYEFAFRHKMPDGELFNGFVTTSADKIFESTHAR